MVIEEYEIEMKLKPNLKKIIAETREITQVLYEFADKLEEIDKRYAKEDERDKESE